MGFSKRAVERAINAINNVSETDVDRLVAWLLENSSDDNHIAGERLNLSEKNERDACNELSLAIKVRIWPAGVLISSFIVDNSMILRRLRLL